MKSILVVFLSVVALNSVSLGWGMETLNLKEEINRIEKEQLGKDKIETEQPAALKNGEKSKVADKENKSEKVTDSKEDKANYSDNNWFQDFEVHFFTSLPFTALYSYVAVTTMDAMVQGNYAPAFKTTNTWMIVGLAIGSSIAIALGSNGRVPDQTLQYEPQDLNHEQQKPDSTPKMEILKISY